MMDMEKRKTGKEWETKKARGGEWKLTRARKEWERKLKKGNGERRAGKERERKLK
jgi:hypothetical protein